MNHKAKLEKALAFDEPEVVDAFTETVTLGGRKENARLAPLHEALVAAVEALEFYASEDSQYGEQARSALSKIDKALGDM